MMAKLRIRKVIKFINFEIIEKTGSEKEQNPCCNLKLSLPLVVKGLTHSRPEFQSYRRYTGQLPCIANHCTKNEAFHKGFLW